MFRHNVERTSCPWLAVHSGAGIRPAATTKLSALHRAYCDQQSQNKGKMMIPVFIGERSEADV